MPESRSLEDWVNDIHATVRREVVAKLGSCFAPHTSGNPLDLFLKDYDKNALLLVRNTLHAYAEQECTAAYYQGAKESGAVQQRERADMLEQERDALLAVAWATQAYLDAQEDRRKVLEGHPKDIEQPLVLARVMRLREGILSALAHPDVQRLMKEAKKAGIPP